MGSIGQRGGIVDREGKYWTARGNVGWKGEILDREGKYWKEMGKN